MHIRLLSLFFLLISTLLSHSSYTQCIIATEQDIPDNDTLEISILVTGLLDNDLGSVTQGICGIGIDFMHEYLGDLTITVVSPSGTMVTLVGPVSGAILSTNLSLWNIQFEPCMTPAMPDAGFSAVWDNNQSWQVFTHYTGSYHPHSGCLEDFNVGSANGVWTFILVDHEINFTGSIDSVELIFCNPAGLQCMECEPNAGTLSPSSFVICEGDNIQSTDLSIDFGGSPPSPAIYSYEYLLLSGNTIIRNGTSFSENPLPGFYTICGLSYATADSVNVNNLLATGDYNQLIQAIIDNTICADTGTCTTLEVLSIPDTTFIDRNLCEGASFSFGGQIYNMPGVYYQTHDGISACDSVFEITITQSLLNVIIAPPDTLYCGVPNITINSVVTGSMGVVNYEWTSSTGGIVGPSNLASVTVNQPGQYLLLISDQLCSTTASIMVIGDADYPQVFLGGGNLNCIQTSLNLTPIIIPTNSSITWSGPNGFSSVQPSITVTEPGNYSLIVTNAEGCSTNRIITIGIDTSTRVVDIIIVSKNCSGQFATLGNTIFTDIADWQWTGPNGFMSGDFRINVTDPGLYSLTTTFFNGCQRTSSYMFDGDFAIPDLTAVPSDTLHCNVLLPVSISSNTPGVTYGWTGPGGFTSSQSTILVNQAGFYNGTVYAPNGCNSQTTVEVVNGNDIFDFQIFTDTLTCTTDTIQIGVIAPEADLFHWSNYPGPDSLQSSILVATAGTFTVTMMDTNSGCNIVANIEVISNLNSPRFFYTVEPITCTDPVSELAFVPFAGQIYSDVYWVLPDLTVMHTPVIQSNDPGIHELWAFGPNGCPGLWRVRIPFDTLPPVFFLEADSLGCDLQTTLQTIEIDSLQSISWTGPGGFNSIVINPVVMSTGTYTAIGTSSNGCTSQVSVIVYPDFTPPPSQLIYDSLDCINADIELITSSNVEIISYEWKNGSGVVISTDSIVLVSNPGIYTIQIEGTNHCTTLDSIILDPPDFPMINILSDTLTCRLSLQNIVSQSDVLNSSFVWMNASGDTLSVSEELLVDSIGPFTIAVTAPNGCETRDTLLIPIDTLPPISMISMIGEVRCQNRDFILDGAGSIPSNVNYTWTTIRGMIIGPTDLALAEARDTGTYFLIVEDPDNGCTDIDTLRVSEHPSSITKMFLEITPPECSGDANGQIQVNGVQGGIEPFLFQLENFPPQSLRVFPGLAAGSYLVRIYDAEGCIYDSIVTIIPTNPFSADAGPDIEIFIGETALLSGSSDINPASIVSQSWDSSGVILCTDCFEATVSPYVTSHYRFQVVSETGCAVEDEVTVFVIEKGKFFIPNVFTPNGDNVNDEIRFYPSPGIGKVIRWVVFDRWGNAVFGKTDFNPADPTVFWDGTTQGSVTLNPGVFPYIIEVELVNGNREIHHGNITLLR